MHQRAADPAEALLAQLRGQYAALGSVQLACDGDRATYDIGGRYVLDVNFRTGQLQVHTWRPLPAGGGEVMDSLRELAAAFLTALREQGTGRAM
jgi:hypothetical protein